LDEPTSALDIAHQVDVLALVHRLSQQRGLTVVAVLHDINMAAIDKFGRKPLQIIGALGMALGMFSLGTAFYTQASGLIALLSML
ncbi:MFS transporter, partial [Salmonella enterica subsp. enterica serovar Montevideo]|nr:MFS transporter [Salmonella enterica subsp. enterica serovar Montevideo]